MGNKGVTVSPTTPTVPARGEGAAATDDDEVFKLELDSATADEDVLDAAVTARTLT